MLDKTIPQITMLSNAFLISFFHFYTFEISLRTNYLAKKP